MSAYLVEEHHIAYLAQYYKASYQGERDSREVYAIADILAKANLDSIAYRYPSDHETPDTDAMYTAGCYDLANSALWNAFDPRQVIMSARCYEYQACEPDNYDQSDAAKIINQIIRDAASKLSDGKNWGAPKPMYTNVVRIA